MKKDRAFILCFLIVFLTSVLVFFLTALIQNIPLKTLFAKMVSNAYKPNHNFFANDNALYFYQVILWSIIIAYMLKVLVWRGQRPLDLPSLLCAVLTGTLLLTTILQMFGQTYYLMRTSRWVSGKSASERYPGPLKEIVGFAGFCRQKLPGNHRCELISDLDISLDPWMYFHRTLAYHLYPIDIRGIRSMPSDCVIVFVAANALSLIPEGYSIIEKWNSENLLAIKDSPHP